MRCTAITRSGKRCHRGATLAFIWRLDWRAACAQHRGYFASSETVELPLDRLSPWLRGEEATRFPATPEDRFRWGRYMHHLMNPTTTSHLADPLSDAIAHGYGGTLD
jgi:hypothetical protein